MRIENLPYASLANTKYTCCSDKTLIIRDSKNSPARTCHRLPVLQISGRYQCRISSCSLGSSYELRKWFSPATTWRSRSPLLFILNASYHNGNALFCRCPIKKEILLLAALIILAATDGKRDSPCLTIVAIIHIWDSPSSSFDRKNCQDILSITCFLHSPLFAAS